MDFYKTYREAGFHRDTLAKYIDVSEQTIKRWEKTDRPPRAVFLLLKILGKKLDYVNAGFAGFYFWNGELYTPERTPITAGQIRSIPFLNMTIEFYHQQERSRSKAVIQAERFNVIDFKSRVEEMRNNEGRCF